MQVNELILPLEPLLTSGTLLASILARLSSSGMSFTEGMIERSLLYGHNAADQSHSSLKDTSAALSETISSLLGAVKNLHSCLGKLIRTASSDAGFLHKVNDRSLLYSTIDWLISYCTIFMRRIFS